MTVRFIAKPFFLVLFILTVAAQQSEDHDIIIDSAKGSVKLFAFIINSSYDFNLNFTILPHPILDVSGNTLDGIISMRFIYLYFVNDYGGIDFFPFTDRHLYLSYKSRWFRPGTEVRLGYTVDTAMTEFFRPGFLRIMHKQKIHIISRLHVKAQFHLRLSGR